MSRRFLLLLLFLLGLAISLQAQPKPAAPPATVLDPVKEGRDLAARLRAAAPAQDSEFTGTLIITPARGKPREIPVTSRILVGKTNWQVVYVAGATSNAPGESLTIIRAPDVPGAYFLIEGSATTKPAAALTSGEIWRPFAGSDFWLVDLGLEFFRWPGQRLLKFEMRRSRSCRVLESTRPDPAPGQYARVLSWIDVESNGLLRAEAYNRDNQLMKEFFVDRIRKVDDVRQVESMRITSELTGQETELRFDLKKK